MIMEVRATASSTTAYAPSRPTGTPMPLRAAKAGMLPTVSDARKERRLAGPLPTGGLVEFDVDPRRVDKQGRNFLGSHFPSAPEDRHVSHEALHGHDIGPTFLDVQTRQPFGVAQERGVVLENIVGHHPHVGARG